MPNRTAKFKTLFVLTIMLILIAGISLRAANFKNVSARTGDERTYTKQAKVILDEGFVNGTRMLVKEFNSNRGLWIYPSPARIGYDWLLASLMKLFKSTDIALGSYISIVASVFTLILVCVISIRFFDPVVALFSTLFMSASAAQITIARRTWQDALFTLIGLFTLYCSMEIVRAPKRIIWYILYLMAAGYLLLVKESALIVFGLSALWIAYNLVIKERSVIGAIAFIASCAIVSAAAYALLFYSCGGHNRYFEIYRHIREVVGASTYGRENQSGPWIDFITGLYIISPLSFILFLAEVIRTVSFPGNGDPGDPEIRRSSICLILFSIIFFSLFLAVPDSQNYRFVSIVFAPFYIIAGLGFSDLLKLLHPFARNVMILVMPILIAVIILAAMWDYQTFVNINSSCGAVDLPVKSVMAYSN